ncbi:MULTISPECIES: protein kinase [unclassified Crossiella]|uniref:serine/threonine protein kinase n=1 Tax=unclassified Crossiella TaxID=2620835 RepID=UPI001FFF2223|nr:MULTISPECIES: protein kinase [unclassified Crossiella]MCK2242483.1 protein kinase [Crossiella sp. S99.2]MCK2254487.1 protein kinase [Crossiella sp. S99.1]
MTSNGPEELVLLGDGPVATVYAGVRADTGEAYALKVFPAKLPKRTRAELDRELARLAGLRDRAPVLVADAVEDTPDGRTALRMELCSQSLRELVTSCGRLSVPDAIALGRAVATALSAAHGAGLVHGGVTPGNLLFRPTGEPVLADLGLTLRRAYPRDQRTGIDFAAPETLRDGTVDERSDLYGLGALLHLALSGESPHPGAIGEPEGERMLRVLGTPVPPLNRADVPEALVAVVSALLSKDPALRPAEAAVVSEWLARIGGPETRTARPTTQGRGFDDFAEQVPAYRPAPPHGTPGPHQPGGPAARPGQPVAGYPGNSATGRRRPAPQPGSSAPGAPAAADPGPLAADRPDLPADNFPDASAPHHRNTTQSDKATPAPPQPRGAPLVISGPARPERPASRTGLVLGGVGVLAVLAVGAVLLISEDPAEMALPPGPVPASATPSTAEKPVEIVLKEPVVRGNKVELNWHSSEAMYFSVAVARENQDRADMSTLQRSTSLTVDIDPNLKYCFQVSGSSSGAVHKSQIRAINGATCRD